MHSLTSLFGSDMLGKHVPIEGVRNLWAYEIDTRQRIERNKVETREKIRWFLKFADITTKADDFVELATMNPRVRRIGDVDVREHDRSHVQE